METLSKGQVLDRKREILERMEKEIFIYPTDTIYGIGCDATNVEAVRKIRIIKKRFESPFSVIAPSKKWIYDNCEISAEAERQLCNIPGPYTIILPLKNKEAVSEDVNLNMKTLGIRIPEHWISDLVREFGKPIVTTSANEQGRDFMTKAEDLSTHLKQQTNFLIDEGTIEGKPSKIIKVTDGSSEVLRV